jgi:hypothetical protein
LTVDWSGSPKRTERCFDRELRLPCHAAAARDVIQCEGGETLTEQISRRGSPDGDRLVGRILPKRRFLLFRGQGALGFQRVLVEVAG